MWVTERDPNLAWIQLVSAVEVVSTDIKLEKPAWHRIEKTWPALWALLAKVEPAQRAAAGNLLAPRVKSTGRFLKFLTARLAPPPENRPPDTGDDTTTGRVNWDDMEFHLQKIYDYRSQALHDGRPFPWPM